MRHIRLKMFLFMSAAWLLTGPVAFAADPVASAATVAPPATQNSFLDALTNGTPTLDMRYRFENVDQDGFAHAANANTLRTRLGYETGVYKDFKAKLQVQNLMPIGGELYNDGTNGQTSLPTVADPRQTLGLYQANLTWQGLPQSTVTVGRQALALNNERWIGAVDWRQLGQTMDSITAQNHSLSNVNFAYSYVFHVNRIFGPRAGSAANISYDTQAHLLNADYTGIPGVKLTGYSYLLDLSNAPTLSSATTGARVEAKHAVLDNVNALFNGEYARQVSYADNPASFGFNYYLVEPGVGLGPVSAKVGYEVMGGDGTRALQAPLGTGHAFNGWAEKFLSTPAGGLENVHVALDYKSSDYNDWLNATVAKFTWYDFKANSSNLHYGNEYDFWLGQTFFKHYTVGLQYANFRADQLASATDTHKIVVQLQAKY